MILIIYGRKFCWKDPIKTPSEQAWKLAIEKLVYASHGVSVMNFRVRVRTTRPNPPKQIHGSIPIGVTLPKYSRSLAHRLLINSSTGENAYLNSSLHLMVNV